MGALTQGDQSKIVQVVSAAIAAATGTTAIPDDTSAPLVSEGTQVASLAITPKSASNKVRLRVNFSAYIASAGSGLIAAVFRGSTLVGAVRAAAYDDPGVTNGGSVNVSAEFEDEPASVAEVTYSVRVGKYAGPTWYVNRSAGSATALASSMANSRFTAEELRA